MYFLENICHINEDQEEVIKSIVNNRNSSFPFYLSRSTDNYKNFVHILMKRKDSPPLDQSGIVSSSYYKMFFDIFNNFCASNNIRVSKVLRAAINYSIYFRDWVSEPHVDHIFPHHNFILYLTNCRGGETLIYDEGGNVIQSIPPQKYKAVVFSGDYHNIAEFYPGDDRFVVVFTFIKD